MFISRLFTVSSVLALNIGCASLSESECQIANWHALGYEQGSYGRSASQFNDYQKDCAKHQIKADYSTFKAGYDEGLTVYCTFEQGLLLGKGGSNYNTHCPSSRFAQFGEGYTGGLNRFCNYENGYHNGAKGKRSNNNCDVQTYPEYDQGFIDGTVKYSLGQGIEQLEDELAQISQDIEDTLHKMQIAEAVLVEEGRSVLERKNALADLKHYKRYLLELDVTYHAREAELVNAKTEYQRL